MDLREVLDEIATGVEFDIERLPDHPVEKIGELCDAASNGLRTLAGCSLLLDADANTYYHQLARSADVRRYYLERCQHEGPSLRNTYRAAGNSRPLFDALAGRRVDLAVRLAGLSNTTWWEGEEYEEDFYFAHLFHLLVRNDASSQQEVRAALGALEKALSGSESAKLAVCLALVARDQRAFDVAFVGLLDAREGELAEQGEPYTPYDEAESRAAETFYIEGLAVLNVADLVGLTTQREYRYCPAIARAPA